MSDSLFREGGPYNVRRTGREQVSMQIALPTDTAGMTSRECRRDLCSPGAFKVKFGTGITDGHAQAFCPYCGAAADPSDFVTQEQLRYAQEIALGEATEGINRMITKTLGLGPTGKKKLGGGLLSVEMTFKPIQRPLVRRPSEERLRRDVTCPHCTLEHAVYGLAVWCPDCGRDIFVTHVEAECGVVRAMLRDVDRRRTELGTRGAARDIENALEDTVSILEASLKGLSRRRLLDSGLAPEEVESILVKKVRNRFQSYEGAVEVLALHFQIDLTRAMDARGADRLRHTLEKRHPITHNLGIVDRKYLEKVRTAEAEGRDVHLNEIEVLAALDAVVALVRFVQGEMFPAAAPS